MKKYLKISAFALFIMVLSLFLYGCDFGFNSNMGGGADMTPRLISLSGEASTTDVIQQVKSAIVGIRSQISGGYAVGSGVAVRAGGYILTNQHVISSTRGITIFFADGSSAGASLIWQDAAQDLAVIKSSKDMPYLECETSNVQVGQDVLAIGTPLSLAFGHTVTKGIVSALNRTLEVDNGNGTVTYMQNLIQHDASINPGNSGGPLINLSGKVVGINTLKASDAEGIGFAIPIISGESIVNRLSVNNSYTPPYMGVLGIASEYAIAKEMITEGKGLYIIGVDKSSVAGLAGILEGDIIYKINDTPINDFLDLRRFIYNHSAGDNARVYLIRSGALLEVEITLSEKLA